MAVALSVPDGASVRRVLGTEARRTGRSIDVDVVRLRAFEREIRASARGLESVNSLVARAVELGMQHRPAGASRAEAGWLCGQAAATENGASLSTAQRDRSTEELDRLWNESSGTTALDAGALQAWVVRQLSGHPSPPPPEPVRAAILAARTGYARGQLEHLDKLGAAAAAVLRERRIHVAQLPLGEQRPRAACVIDSDDRRAIDQADLLIAFLHPPSVGVGMLLSYGLRHYPVVLLVASAGEARPPLVDGMQVYAEVITTDDPDELAEEVSTLLQRRGLELLERSAARLAQADRWAALKERGAPLWALPHWLPRSRVDELLREPWRLSSATVQELEAIAQGAAVPWPALAPEGPAGLAVTQEEFQTVARVAAEDSWPTSLFQEVITTISAERSGDLAAPRARASLSLETPFEVRRYVNERGLTGNSQ